MEAVQLQRISPADKGDSVPKAHESRLRDTVSTAYRRSAQFSGRLGVVHRRRNGKLRRT
jgi:hypothetical protein